MTNENTGSQPERPIRPNKRRPAGRYPYLFRLLHWVLAATLVLLVASGLSLHASARPDWSLFSGRLPPFFWPGQVHLVHLPAAILFSASLVAASWFYFRRKGRRRPTHLVLLGGGLLMILSAPLLLNPVGPGLLYSAARGMHAIVGLVVLPLAFLWHLLRGLGRHRRVLVPAFHPWKQPSFRQLAAFVPLVLVVACLVLCGLPVSPPWRDLVVRRINPAEPDRVDMTTLPWHEAPSLGIELANGIGFDRGRTEVSLRAFHDGRELFVLAEWFDPREDRQYQPWEKTPDGWRHLVTIANDESVYYEDKFGLVFPTAPDWQFERFGCATYCHVGGGRPYGYKSSEQIVDVWHWKSTRTDPVDQVDDKYWWKADFSAKPPGRYGDPKEDGGYKKNASADGVHPAFLPDGPTAVKQGIILRDQAAAYTLEAAAQIAPGTIIPGIVASAAVGDRGDLSCRSQHEAGRWRLYIRRKLNTGSQYDVAFVPGGKHPFSCAAFDHSSKRHAYGFSVYRLVLEP